jgi:hypothetical protein
MDQEKVREELKFFKKILEKEVLVLNNTGCL